MKLYVTFTSPYARLTRIVVLEKGLQDRVEVIAAQTRVADSPYYKINPSGRVPYLIDDAGVGMEDTQFICAYLDSHRWQALPASPGIGSGLGLWPARGQSAQLVRWNRGLGA